MSTEPQARLILFGGATLEGDRGPVAGRSAQRRRLALLAMLALARRGVSRDKLIGCLWEEADTDRARRLLSESVYVIRKALGEDAILAAGDELRLNESVVWCDVTAFADAVAAGELDRAAELYRGPLLDGFFVSDALEFEQWAERERDRLARTCGDVLRRLAEAADANGDFGTSVKWWRLLCAHQPYAAAPALGLMRAADAAGDRASALQHAAAHAARLRTDLEAEPDAAVEAFARELRESSASYVTPVRIAQVQSLASPRAPEPAQLQAAAAPGIPRIRRRKRIAIIAGVVLLVTAVITIAKLDRSLALDAAPEAYGHVAVLPANVHGPSDYLAHGLALSISGNLDGVGELRTVDANALFHALSAMTSRLSPDDGSRIANRFGARYFIVTDVIESGRNVEITASVYDTADAARAVASPSVSGVLDSIAFLTDELSAQLLEVLASGQAEQIGFSAVFDTRSFPAMEQYWAGEKHFRAGRYDRAVEAFARATSLDSSYALAHYRMSVAAEWGFDFARARRAARAALAWTDRLSDVEAGLLLAWNAFLQGDYEYAEREYGRIATSYPANVEALVGLAEVRAHFNPVRGEPARTAATTFQRVLDLVPSYAEARYHALEFAARERDLPRYDALFAGLDPANEQRLAWQAVRAWAWGDEDDRRTALAALDTAGETQIAIAAGRVAAHTHEFAGARTIARLLVQPHRTPDWRAGGHLFSAQLHLAAGDTAAARRELERAEPLERDWTRELNALYRLHPFADSSAAVDDVLADLGAWRPHAAPPNITFFFSPHAAIHRQLRWYLLGLLSVRADDLDGALRYRSELLRSGTDDETRRVALSFAGSIDGHIAIAQGRTTDAIRHLLDATLQSPPEFLALSPFHSRAHDRFLLAELYRARGDTAQAIRWYRSLLEGFDFVYAAPAHARLAGMFAGGTDPMRGQLHARELERLTRR